MHVSGLNHQPLRSFLPCKTEKTNFFFVYVDTNESLGDLLLPLLTPVSQVKKIQAQKASLFLDESSVSKASHWRRNPERVVQIK